MGEELIDIGANLTQRWLRKDLAGVLARASAAGVHRIVVTGTTEEGSQTAAEMASGPAAGLFSTAGVHPHYASSCGPRTLERLRALATQPQVVAIGECGLDFNRDKSPRPVQLEWFERQVELAVELELPLFLHEREASQALLEVLRRHRSGIRGAVVHCFTGEGEALDAYLDLDLHIGITGWICDERRGTHLHELVRRIPLERLMVETDAPYLLPRTIRPRPRGRRNEPCYLPYVVETLAECLELSTAEVARATTATAARFFGLEPAPATRTGGGA